MTSELATTGDGIGIMLSDGLGCYDLDHCLIDGKPNDVARRLLDSLDPIYVERSMSGEGLHIFIHADEQRGYKRDGVEFYSQARFIAVTGDRFDY